MLARNRTKMSRAIPFNAFREGSLEANQADPIGARHEMDTKQLPRHSRRPSAAGRRSGGDQAKGQVRIDIGKTVDRDARQREQAKVVRLEMISSSSSVRPKVVMIIAPCRFVRWLRASGASCTSCTSLSSCTSCISIPCFHLTGDPRRRHCLCTPPYLCVDCLTGRGTLAVNTRATDDAKAGVQRTHQEDGRTHMYPGAHAVRHADRPAVIMASSGASISYGEYEARANRLAHLAHGGPPRR